MTKERLILTRGERALIREAAHVLGEASGRVRDASVVPYSTSEPGRKVWPDDKKLAMDDYDEAMGASKTLLRIARRYR